MKKLDLDVLDKVCGGTTPQQDAKNMLQGAAKGARFGPWGAIVGTVAGSIPGFVDAGRDYFRERQRSQDLDKQREEMRKKHPEYFTK